MRGIMLKVNDELYVLVGKVIAVQEEAEKCIWQVINGGNPQCAGRICACR